MSDSKSRLNKKQQPLANFVTWVERHISGYEKGEAQPFLIELFRAFGHKGVLEAGGAFEFRLKKASKSTAFADLVYKPVVLVEMKQRGEDLSRHYRQALDYWTGLVPGRPRYVVLCNFDEFWVYDFETQVDVPVDKVPLPDLPHRYGPLAFLFSEPERPVFGNDHEAVTREAANKLAACFNSLIERKIDRVKAQGFILQTMVAMFSQNIGLLEQYLLTRILEDCRAKPKEAYDLLGNLFAAMNSPGITAGGRYKGVPYFNGGLFASPAYIELTKKEIDNLIAAAQADWSKVRPEIFGTLFEHSLGRKDRHAFGAHFTSPTDIMKIVGPTIVYPWRERIENADSLRELRALRQRMQTYTVLDPACGSGNFLYLAYRELKRLEARIVERMVEKSARRSADQREFGFVTARNFFGIDINPFAVELAKVSMMIARKLAIEELHITEQALPLDNLDENFIASDALINGFGSKVSWPKTDVVIGNPPFLGAKRLKPERGQGYAAKVRAAYPEVPGMADYCVYWIRKTHDVLPEATKEDPLSGRAGLVGTQNIRTTHSRVGGLDHVVRSGTIIEAIENQPWSGEANVNVSIVNWIKTKDDSLLPAAKRLWFRTEPMPGAPPPKKGATRAQSKLYELDSRVLRHIGPALSPDTDTSDAARLSCNTQPQRVFQGITPGHAAFVLRASEREALRLLEQRKDRSTEVIYPYLIGNELLTGTGKPQRYLIDFQPLTLPEAATYGSIYKRIEKKVLPDRLKKLEQGRDAAGNPRPHHKRFYDTWWRLSWERAEMVQAIKALDSRFIVCSRVTKRPIFAFVSTSIRPGDRLQTFMFDDDYSFGILQSSVHWKWFISRCPKQTERFIYSTEEVFDSFPWPQYPTKQQVNEVAKAGRQIRKLREPFLVTGRGGLRALYRTLEMPGKNPLRDAHKALDIAVLSAFGFSERKDTLSQLLELNHELAKLLNGKKTVMGPGVPSTYKDISSLVTDDFLGADVISKR